MFSSAGVFRPSQEFVERGLPQRGVLHLAVARWRAARRWDVLVDGRVDVRGGVVARAGASSPGRRAGSHLRGRVQGRLHGWRRHLHRRRRG